MKNRFSPVYPAYNPRYKGFCSVCKTEKYSNNLLVDSETNDHVCSKCAFVFFMYDSRNDEVERDRKEINEFGKFIWCSGV